MHPLCFSFALFGYPHTVQIPEWIRRIVSWVFSSCGAPVLSCGDHQVLPILSAGECPIRSSGSHRCTRRKRSSYRRDQQMARASACPDIRQLTPYRGSGNILPAPENSKWCRLFVDRPRPDSTKSLELRTQRQAAAALMPVCRRRLAHSPETVDSKMINCPSPLGLYLLRSAA